MKNLKYIVTILLLSGIAFSCNDDFLEKNPSDKLSSASFWSDENDADAGLVAVYDALSATKNSNPERGAATWSTLGLFDLITPIGNDRMNWFAPIANGIHTGTLNAVLQSWRLTYRGVVRANDFLDNIDKIPFQGNNADIKKKRMIGEAKFLRALYYYFLVELYGDLPLFENVPLVEDAQTPRSPKEKVLKLIKDDLTYAIANLPTPATTQKGRASKGAAMALRVKVALFEKDWATAATVSGDIMNMSYKLVPNYANVININNENNEEVIFSVQHVFNNSAEPGNYGEKLYANASCSSNGWSVLQPTLWFVDQFERIIQNPQEGIDYVNEDPTRIPNDIYAYFEGRDPRMDHTIIRPGSHFIDLKDKDILYPHQFSGANNSQTGLHMRKYVVPGSGKTLQWDSPLDYILFRYADILLCHVEAVAMRDGVGTVSQQILDKTINAVRARASVKLPKYTAGNITMNNIYHERIVELGFEGWTYFDMKRSGMIEINNGYEVRGLTIQVGKTVFFNPIPVGPKRFFDPAVHYLFPIPSSEIESSNQALIQNPGYPQ